MLPCWLSQDRGPIPTFTSVTERSGHLNTSLRLPLQWVDLLTRIQALSGSRAQTLSPPTLFPKNTMCCYLILQHGAYQHGKVKTLQINTARNRGMKT